MAGNKQVFILTNFSTYLKSFSPIIVVGEQLKMLTRAGYHPVLLVAEGWEPPEDSIFAQVETIQLYPAAQHDPSAVEGEIDGLVDIVYEQLQGALPPEGTVITHDLIFLPDYTIYNLAARKLALETKLSWIHWVHSATNPEAIARERGMYGDKYSDTLKSFFPNSIIAYPNAFDIRRVAHGFGFEEDHVVEVPHSTDPTEGLHPLVQRLYDELRLGDVDVLMVYPLRLDRGKTAEANVELIAGFRRIGVRAHLLFCDFQSTGDDKVIYRQDLHKLADKLDIGDRVTFLSEFDDIASMEVSHDIILDLFVLSNLFLMPSKSETYSLITQEAMLKGNLCIMNHDFPPFRQIFGNNALYRTFDGANISSDGMHGETTRTYQDADGNSTKQGYYEGLAKEMRYYLVNDKVLAAKTWVRTQRNPDAVFRNYIEPLIHRKTDAEV